MFIPKNRGFKRRYMYGGSGLFDSLAKIVSSSLASNTAKQLASTAMNVIKDVGKSTTTKLGKNMIETMIKPKVKAVSQKPVVKTVLKTPTAQKAIQKLNEKSKDILNKYIDPTPSASSLIDGGAISIQDYIRKMNGAGLKAI